MQKIDSNEPLPIWVKNYKELLKFDYGCADEDVEKILQYFNSYSEGTGKSCISIEEAERIAEQNRMALLAELDEEEKVAKAKVVGKSKKGSANKKKKK